MEKRTSMDSGRDCDRCGNPISKDTNMGFGVASPQGDLCQSCGNEVV